LTRSPSQQPAKEKTKSIRLSKPKTRK
jgi:hypothetical protein